MLPARAISGCERRLALLRQIEAERHDAGLGEPFGRAQVGFVRFSPTSSGSWEVAHEDPERRSVRRWERAASARPG
jgi:hypothetical protein